MRNVHLAPKASPTPVKIVGALLGIIATLMVLEGTYRTYKFIKYGMVDYVDLHSVGYIERDVKYGQVLKKHFQSDSIPQQIRVSQAGRAYHMERIFTTNSYGYRGAEFSLKKGDETFRVVAFGGSTTMGMEVDDADTWPALLESRLGQDARFLQRQGVKKVEVINAATGGWRSREGLLRLEDEVRHFEPDLILVAFNWNDFGYAMKGHDPDAPIYPKRQWWQASKIVENLKVRSLVAQERDLDHIKRLTSGLERNDRWVIALRRHILGMQAIAREIHAAMILVNLPGLCRKQAVNGEREKIVSQTRVTLENFPLWAALKDFETEVFRELGRDHGIPVLDIHGAFEQFSGMNRLDLFTDEMHMTARGTRETAEFIARALTDDKVWVWQLPSRAPRARFTTDRSSDRGHR